MTLREQIGLETNEKSRRPSPTALSSCIQSEHHLAGFSDEMITRFGQPYSSTKGRPGGGLGLFLLVNVLRKLGGSASVANRDAGGAIVRITLPLSAIAAEGRAA